MKHIRQVTGVIITLINTSQNSNTQVDIIHEFRHGRILFVSYFQLIDKNKVRYFKRYSYRHRRVKN